MLLLPTNFLEIRQQTLDPYGTWSSGVCPFVPQLLTKNSLIFVLVQRRYEVKFGTATLSNNSDYLKRKLAGQCGVYAVNFIFMRCLPSWIYPCELYAEKNSCCNFIYLQENQWEWTIRKSM